MFDEYRPLQALAPCRPYTGDDDLDRLLTPARYFARPRDVLKDAMLSLREKRAILSSWASDVCAADSQPCSDFSLRTRASFDEVVDVLQRLEGLADAVLQMPEHARDTGSRGAST
jgi:hypothetical protein